MQDLQFVKYVAERDVDLVLLEELHVSADFLDWFVKQVLGTEYSSERFLGAWHSVTHPAHGESDLVVLMNDAHDLKTAILIENKIDALPQPDQAARYQLRGNAGIENGHWGGFRTCMIAPRAYLDACADARRYDSQVSYEAIRDWLHERGERDSRSAYRARIIQEAIEQNRRGYQTTPHEGVTRFWIAYWNLVRAEFPRLHMKQPEQIPAGSDWPEFRNLELGSGRRIVHKLLTGAVDLEIKSAAEFAESIESRNREVLGAELEVVRTGKSASIRCRVPSVDRLAEFETQVEAIRTGLKAGYLLLDISGRLETRNVDAD